MNKSDAINELAAALSNAQAEILNPSFDSNNPFFRSRYASLAAVRDAVVPFFAKHGLSVIQEIRHEAGVSHCSTTLLHSSGQWIEQAPFSVPVAKADAQGACAGATYARRASLQALACVVGDGDDDGEVTVGRGGEASEKPHGGYKPKYQKTGAPDPVGPVGEIPDHSAAAPAANAEPAAGRPSVAVGFLNSLAASSTEQQVDGITKQIALVSKSITEPEKVKLREAVAAARLRVAATPAKLVDVPNLLRELTWLRQQLGDGMFNAMLQKAGGEERAGYGLSAEKLVALREECVKAIG
jgi:hypothetical protein